VDGRAPTRATRLLLVVYAALGLLAGVPLYLGTERTDQYFAWTIRPPLTAAFLGAAYWAAFSLDLLARAERSWVRVRVGFPARFVFTTLMLAATLVHLDRFHLDSGAAVARGVAWAWLIVYVAVPPLTLAVLVREARIADPAASEDAALPRRLRLALAAQAALMVGLGAALFAAPLEVAWVWPWPLTPLTGRAIGAWLVGLGLVGAHMVLDNGLRRVRNGLTAYAVLAFLQGVAVARYPGDIDWGDPRAWVYLAVVLSIFAAALAGWLAGRQAQPSGSAR